jgi:hypothetical protein
MAHFLRWVRDRTGELAGRCSNVLTWAQGTTDEIGRGDGAGQGAPVSAQTHQICGQLFGRSPTILVPCLESQSKATASPVPKTCSDTGFGTAIAVNTIDAC